MSDIKAEICIRRGLFPIILLFVCLTFYLLLPFGNLDMHVTSNEAA